MRLRLLAAAVLAAAIPGIAPAQDARRGADLAAQTCVACQGDNGRSQTEDIPSLAGQPADFITLQM
ncbi:MAG: Cytochrome, partial [Rubritepida sp.]|nr:Cytochrome [Rubritepida sp.]